MILCANEVKKYSLPQYNIRFFYISLHAKILLYGIIYCRQDYDGRSHFR